MTWGSVVYGGVNFEPGGQEGSNRKGVVGFDWEGAKTWE